MKDTGSRTCSAALSALFLMLALLLPATPALGADLGVGESVEDGFAHVAGDVAFNGASPSGIDGSEPSDNVRAIAGKVFAAYDAAEAKVDFSGAGYTVGEFRDAMGVIVADPEYYWASSSFGISFRDANGNGAAEDGEELVGASLRYVVDVTEVPEVKRLTESKVAEALSWVDSERMSEFEAAQALHDYLVRTCAYDSRVASAGVSVTPSRTAYGALVEGKAVCQGYSLAYKLLLSRAGIPAVYVVSTPMNHSWNMVQMDDGSWYHTDVTWDDPLYSSGSDGGFDHAVSHDYFLRSDASMRALDHSGWEAAYTTPEADYPNRDFAVYDGPAAGAGHVYAHSERASSNGVSFLVQWDDAGAGEATAFHVTQVGGSANAKARMDVPTYIDVDGSQESVCDPSRKAWGSYSALGDGGHDFSFEFTASGTYRIYFYFMDLDNSVSYLRCAVEVAVNDDARPAVSEIVSDAVAQCRSNTDGSEYEMALWLHDWTLGQLEYDRALNWCSAESGLTRHAGTCESYQRIYAKLLGAAGIANGRVTGNGHTWNAVRIDGKWCQMDLTWDDTDASWYGDLDQRHLYFGLTDELMTVAHSDHAKNYQAEGYAWRSSDLSNNYFVRSGRAAEWAGSYAERIQRHLDAREAEFTVEADNVSFPPGISGIQNGIIAYAMNLLPWEESGRAVELVATGGAEGFSFKARYVETVPGPDPAPQISFPDVPEDAWYRPWVQEAAARGLMSGYSDTGLFGPDDSVTRCQVATVLWRAAGCPEPSGAAPFPDVEPGSFYGDAVAWCAERGVVTGYTGGAGAGTFRPWASVTREELAAMAARWAGSRGRELPLDEGALGELRIDDWGAVSPWAVESMRRTASAGVLGGVDNHDGTHSLLPQGTATRAQAAKVFVALQDAAA